MQRLLLAALGAVLAGSACSSNSYGPSGGGSGQPGANQVFMQGSAFNPTTRTVSAGTTVTWVNKDGVAHTATSSSVPAGAATFSSGNVGANGQFQVTFATAGTYQYYCTIHGSPGAGMHGTIIVQ
jgi:plastocyanin